MCGGRRVLNAFVIFAVAVVAAVGAGGRIGFSVTKGDFQNGGAEVVVVEGAVEGRGSHSGVVKGEVVGWGVDMVEAVGRGCAGEVCR